MLSIESARKMGTGINFLDATERWIISVI